MASAMESGSATIATTMPDTMSRGIWRRSSSLSVCLITLNRIGLSLSCCMGSVSLLVVRLRARLSPGPGFGDKKCPAQVAPGGTCAFSVVALRLQGLSSRGRVRVVAAVRPRGHAATPTMCRMRVTRKLAPGAMPSRATCMTRSARGAKSPLELSPAGFVEISFPR